MKAKWYELTSDSNWNTYFEQTNEQIGVLLKHSTACPISYNAYKEFDQFCKRNRKKNASFALIKVIETRAVSDLIAHDLQLKHESPQVIFIYKHKVIESRTHWDVSLEWLEESLSKALKLK